MRTSMTIFRSFIKVDDETGEFNASQVLSRDCYLAWLDHHQQKESPKRAKQFHRTCPIIFLVDGRLPFPPQEEAALLVLVRQKMRWPCFPIDVCVGFTGFRSMGFHEKASSSPPPIFKTTRNRFKRRIPGLDGKRLQDGEFATNFANNTYEYVSLLPEYNLQAYVYLGNLLRYVFFARTAACALRHLATEDAARELCDALTNSNDLDCVVVMSLFSSNLITNVVLAQNAKAWDWLGNVRTSLNTTVPFPLHNVYGVMFAICTAMHAPGRAIPFVDTQFTSLFPGLYFSGTFAFDPSSHLLVLRARPEGYRS
ncbi:hypothetical protein BASA81_013280 [Batrachochytrium salamandrivorans]|nr:hypothetical protein BASA81_013280 [Batrachochytrium salamandrivorans]